MVWDMLEFPERVKAMHRLWHSAWKSQPCLASFPSCSAAPTQENFPKESLAGASLSQDEPPHGISLTLYLQMSTESHWVYLLNAFGTCLVLPISTFSSLGLTVSFPLEYYRSFLDSSHIIYKSILHMVAKRDLLKIKLWSCHFSAYNSSSMSHCP